MKMETHYREKTFFLLPIISNHWGGWERVISERGSPILSILRLHYFPKLQLKPLNPPANESTMSAGKRKQHVVSSKTRCVCEAPHKGEKTTGNTLCRTWQCSMTGSSELFQRILVKSLWRGLLVALRGSLQNNTAAVNNGNRFLMWHNIFRNLTLQRGFS